MNSEWLSAFLGGFFTCVICFIVWGALHDWFELVFRKVFGKEEREIERNHLTITSNDKGVCAVTITDDEGRIKQVLWERD